MKNGCLDESSGYLNFFTSNKNTPKKEGLALSCWSICEMQYLIDNYKLGPTEVSKALGRDVNSVSGMAGILGIRCGKGKEPRYSEEEIQFLRKNWGKMTVKAISRRLKRSVDSIESKAKKLKLGPIYNPGNFTQNEIEKITGINHQTLKRYIEKGIIRATRSKSEKGGFKQITPKELERFLRENPDKWDSRKAKNIWKCIRAKELEAVKVKVQRQEGVVKRHIPDDLRERFVDFVVHVALDASDRIKEARRGPDWLRQKQERDQARYPREGFRWTSEEDAHLRRMFCENKLTYKEMGQRLGRSAGAVNNRLARIIIWDTQQLKKAR